MEKFRVDSDTDNPLFIGLDDAKPLPAPAQAGGSFFSLRFEQISTAAEVIGDFVASAAGVIGAYVAYHALGLGKAVMYPFPVVIGLPRHSHCSLSSCSIAKASTGEAPGCCESVSQNAPCASLYKLSSYFSS